jgi:hypothetical protein
MFSLPVQIAYLAAMLVVFLVAVLLARPRRRRLAGVVLAVLAFTAASGPIDDFAHDAGLWTYPSCVDPPHPPLAVYLGQSLMFVGVTALVAWRVARRFGPRSLRVLVALFCVGGMVRDFSVAAIIPGIIRFGPAPAAQLADLAAWAIVAVFALAIPRFVAGPAKDDAPRAAG